MKNVSLIQTCLVKKHKGSLHFTNHKKNYPKENCYSRTLIKQSYFPVEELLYVVAGAGSPASRFMKFTRVAIPRLSRLFSPHLLTIKQRLMSQHVRTSENSHLRGGACGAETSLPDVTAGFRRQRNSAFVIPLVSHGHLSSPKVPQPMEASQLSWLSTLVRNPTIELPSGHLL